MTIVDLFEWFALDSKYVAEQTDDPKQREMWIRLADCGRPLRERAARKQSIEPCRLARPIQSARPLPRGIRPAHTGGRHGNGYRGSDEQIFGAKQPSHTGGNATKR